MPFSYGRRAALPIASITWLMQLFSFDIANQNNQITLNLAIMEKPDNPVAPSTDRKLGKGNARARIQQLHSAVQIKQHDLKENNPAEVEELTVFPFRRLGLITWPLQTHHAKPTPTLNSTIMFVNPLAFKNTIPGLGLYFLPNRVQESTANCSNSRSLSSIRGSPVCCNVPKRN